MARPGRLAGEAGGMNPRLTVDPIACSGHGACAELLPEWIELDDWGYPMLDGAPIPDDLLPYARRAVAACPTLALRLARAREAA
jgi:ferredoxin